MSRSKSFHRLWAIAANGASRVLISVGTSVISLVVIRTQSEEVWGSAVQWVLMLDFAFSIISWGSNPYLIREFSLDPKNISGNWSASLVARLPLLVVLWIVVICLPVAPIMKFYLSAWALARYLYQLYDPLLLYNKNFLFTLALELTGLLVVLVPILGELIPVTPETVIGLMAAGIAWKSMLTSIRVFVVTKTVQLKQTGIDELARYYTAAFPFLLLTFSGMLQQRMDLYLVAYYLGDRDTAEYQVFINWVIFCQFLASLILIPFAKNIFRVSVAVFSKLERNFMISGTYLSALSMLGVFVVVRSLYRFELPLLHYVMGYAYVLVHYIYALKNYKLGKMRKQATVAVYSFLTSAVNLALGLYLIPAFGTTGALAAATIAQVFLLALYQVRKSAYAVG